MTDLKQTIQADVIAAMRAKEKERLGTLRLLTAAIKQREVDGRTTLKDADIVSVLEKMIKQRRESIKQFEAGNRPELAEKESAEIKILEVYMPEAMSETDIDAAVAEAVKSRGASSIKDMGKVMGTLKAKLQGRADMGLVSAKVRDRLS